MSSHLQQASFYLHATRKPTWILHVNGKESDGIMIHEVAACKHKEALHNMITDLKIKQEIAKLDDPFKVVQPDFTKFYWEIGNVFLDEAKEMYGYKTAE